MPDLDPDADVGVQCYGSRQGAVLCDEARGVAAPGRPFRPDTLCSLWCATKPVAAVHLLGLVEQAGAGLDHPVVDLLDDGWGRPPPTTTLRAVLDHSAGLATPSAAEIMLTPPALRRSLIDAGLAGSSPRPAYSEHLAWDLIGRAITALSGLPAPVALDRWLAALGLGEELVFDATTLPAERIGVAHLRHGGAWYPLLQDLAPRLRAEDRVALGGYASARGLGRFYELLLRHAHQPVAGLPSPELLGDALGRPRPPVADETLGRVCSFAGGFMVHLDQHGFGDRPSPSAFGHAGLLGSSAGFADPATGAVLVAVRNVLSFDEHWVAARRRQLFEAILSAGEGVARVPVG